MGPGRSEKPLNVFELRNVLTYFNRKKGCLSGSVDSLLSVGNYSSLEEENYLRSPRTFLAVI
jgi:hypothetical protein